MKDEQVYTPHEIIARQLMQNIMYDNGMVNRWEHEKYPDKYIKSISKAAGAFFDKHPELLTDENLDEIASGFEDEVEEKFSKYEGFAELMLSLNAYFNRE